VRTRQLRMARRFGSGTRIQAAAYFGIGHPFLDPEHRQPRISSTVLQRSHLRMAGSSRRPLGRLLGVGAILASIFLHGGAAAVALLVLPRMMPASDAHRWEEPPASVDLDLVAPTESEPRPQSASRPRAARRVASLRRSPVASPPVAAAPRPKSDAPDPEPAPVIADPPVRPVLARFALSAGSVAGRSSSDPDSEIPAGGTSTGSGHASATANGERPLAESAVDLPARLATAAPLHYPEAARRAELELDLPLELVVSSQGRVLSAFASAHPGYGLEDAALNAVRGYVFQPARRAGRSVPVKMKWTMQFRLR